jgi:hypothetical protein
MTTPTSNSPANVLYVGGDPNGWRLVDPVSAPAPWQDSSDPVALAVNWPLFGTLVLAPGRASSLGLLEVMPVHNWIPCQVVVPHLYLPAPAEMSVGAPGYALPAGTDLSALEQSIMAAMRDGTTVDVTVSGPSGNGVIVLNGAVLPFAVLCPPNA